MTPLLFSTGISVSSTYDLCTRLHNIRSDITFDIVQHSYIHGGLSLIHAGTASLLARDAAYIAHAHTLTHRTRVAALMPTFFGSVQPCR